MLKSYLCLISIFKINISLTEMNRQLFRGAFLEMQERYQGGHCTQSTNHLMIMYNVVLRSYNSLLLVL